MLRKNLIVLGALLVFGLGSMALLVVLNALGSRSTPTTRVTTSSHAPFYSYVTYHVTDSAGSFSVTYSDLAGGMQQQTSATDFTQTFPIQVGQRGSASLVAQNGSDHGTITCEIEQDGGVIKQATSSGAYVVVSCAAAVGP